MSSQDLFPPDPLAYTRQPREIVTDHGTLPTQSRPVSRRIVRWTSIAALVLFALMSAAFVCARVWMKHAMLDALPRLDGTLSASGLGAPVTVQRDQHGVPTIKARSMDDLVFAQGYVTAQDRLFQMDSLRRHAAGELAEVLGAGLVPHDLMQRTLRIRATADRAVAQLAPDQLHWLEVYARGVNAATDSMHDHLPIEFRLLNYRPKPWVALDSILVSLVMFEDLTNRFPEKLNREALTARVAPDAAPELRAQFLSDLFPVGSWRDHPPSQQTPDLSIPVDEIPQIPLDDSQVKLRHDTPATKSDLKDLLALSRSLAPSACADCQPGSNNWVVSGVHTASGQPLLSNDMHLSLAVPGIWYAANLEAPSAGSSEEFHVAGVTLPGTPFVIVGHNQHVAWGFTNLGADVQDLYIEHLRGSGGSAEFETPDGAWHPVLHQHEVIRVRGSGDRTLDVTATQHGSTPTPIISPMVPSESRSISLRWVIYDSGVLTSPFFDIDSAPDAPALAKAFASFGGPAQNLVYADDHGHIGYHATGRIPLRGPPSFPPHSVLSRPMRPPPMPPLTNGQAISPTVSFRRQRIRPAASSPRQTLASPRTAIPFRSPKTGPTRTAMSASGSCSRVGSNSPLRTCSTCKATSTPTPIASSHNASPMPLIMPASLAIGNGSAKLRICSDLGMERSAATPQQPRSSTPRAPRSGRFSSPQSSGPEPRPQGRKVGHGIMAALRLGRTCLRRRTVHHAYSCPLASTLLSNLGRSARSGCRQRPDRITRPIQSGEVALWQCPPSRDPAPAVRSIGTASAYRRDADRHEFGGTKRRRNHGQADRAQLRSFRALHR